jgi:hypothetical protein
MVNWADPSGKITKKPVYVIASAICRDRSTIIRAVNRLCKRGYLDRIGRGDERGNIANAYWLILDLNSALRANAREIQRAKRDKKRAPGRAKRCEDATLKDAPTRPPPSQLCDTYTPSLPSFPFPVDEGNPCKSAASTQTHHPTNPLVGPQLLVGTQMHPSKKLNRYMSVPIGNLVCPTRSNFSVRQRQCQNIIHALVAELDAWELFDQADLSKAYDAENKADGSGRNFILERLRERVQGDG